MLTKRQADCLIYIERYIKESGTSPSFQEIATGIGLKAKGAVAPLVAALELRGFICRNPGHKKSIQVLRSASFAGLSPAERALTDLLVELEHGVVGGAAYVAAYTVLERRMPDGPQ